MSDGATGAYVSPHKGIPGCRGAEQLGFCVPDMEVATDFFVNVLGFEQFYTMGPFADPSGTWCATHFNIDARAVVKKLRLFRAFNINLELFETTMPGQNEVWPAMQDVGGWHLGFYVDDIHIAHDYLVDSGMRSLGGPKDMMMDESGDQAFFVHLMTEWGFYLELVSYPNGRAYESNFERRLWNPTVADLVAEKILVGTLAADPSGVQ